MFTPLPLSAVPDDWNYWVSLVGNALFLCFDDSVVVVEWWQWRDWLFIVAVEVICILTGLSLSLSFSLSLSLSLSLSRATAAAQECSSY